MSLPVAVCKVEQRLLGKPRRPWGAALKRRALPLVSLVLIGAVGCASRVTTVATPSSVAGLAGTRWVLTELAGTAVHPERQPTLDFGEADRATGNDSCNRFFGPVRIERDTLQFGVLATTRMACPESVAAQATKYLQLLGTATRYQIQGDRLNLYSPGSDIPLQFTRQREK